MVDVHVSNINYGGLLDIESVPAVSPEPDPILDPIIEQDPEPVLVPEVPVSDSLGVILEPLEPVIVIEDPIIPIPFVISNNPYKFIGKEVVGGTGLVLYDFGARFYSPYIPRWLTMDPLAEKYYDISPYACCAGNPVNIVDDDGRSWYFNNQTGDYYAHIDDDDDYIYMISKDEYDEAVSSNDMESSLQLLKGDNLFGYLFNEEGTDNIIKNVMQYFYNYANVTEEGGSTPFFRPGAKVDVEPNDERSDSIEMGVINKNPRKLIIYKNNSQFRGYDIITLIAHEIKHQIDESAGKRYESNKTEN